MEIVRMILQGLFCLLALGIIAVVMLQPGEDAGLGALTGNADTFFSKNKQNSFQGKLALITRGAITVFIVIIFVLLIIR